MKEMPYFSLKNGSIALKKLKRYPKDLIIPRTLNGYAVTSLMSGAFKGSNIVSVQLPESVMNIPPYSFSECLSLKEVKISPHTVNIDKEAFWGCSYLEKVELPTGLLSIGPLAFGDCRRLEDISIPESVVSLSPHAFIMCMRLESIKIPEGIKEIPLACFSGCISLKSVIIPKSVTRIAPESFSDSSKLTVYYGGTVKDWKNISMPLRAFKKDITVKCSDGTVKTGHGNG